MNRFAVLFTILTVLIGLLIWESTRVGTVEATRGLIPHQLGDLVGPDRCAECHESEQAVWLESRHQLGFKEMHRDPLAKAMAKKLGIRRIKSAAECLSCHYTPEERKGKIRAAHGVSCESCHGAGREWTPIHDDFGGAELTLLTESEEHRRERQERCEDLGMKLPSDVADLGRQCFDCHMVSEERIVNVGGHPTGNEFELLTWTQGEVRHNFTGGKKNAEASIDRRRSLFVFGQLLLAEYALRDLHSSTEDGPYRTEAQNRLEQASGMITKLAEKLPELAEITRILESSGEEAASPSMKAKTLGQAIDALSGRRDTLDWSAIDPFLPDSSAYRGTPRKTP